MFKYKDICSVQRGTPLLLQLLVHNSSRKKNRICSSDQKIPRLPFKSHVHYLLFNICHYHEIPNTIFSSYPIPLIYALILSAVGPHLAHYSIDTKDFFPPRVKPPELVNDHLRPSSTKIKNVLSYMSPWHPRVRHSRVIFVQVFMSFISRVMTATYLTHPILLEIIIVIFCKKVKTS